MEYDPVEVGGQLVILGAERISTGEHLTRLMTKPMAPRRRQTGLPHSPATRKVCVFSLARRGFLDSGGLTCWVRLGSWDVGRAFGLRIGP